MTSDSAATATGVLREEHQIILPVVHRLGAMLAAERKGDPLDYDFVAGCITFFRLFVDACHHGEEEGLLFPALEAEGIPADSGPIAMLLDEHVQGRALVGRMATALEEARAGDGSAADELRDAGDTYVALLLAHIEKEDDGLFELADGVIVGPGCRDLCAGYDEVCARQLDGQTKEDLERLAAEIIGAGSP
jgi:hemerythrin-like domain-containing protein